MIASSSTDVFIGNVLERNRLDGVPAFRWQEPSLAKRA